MAKRKYVYKSEITRARAVESGRQAFSELREDSKNARKRRAEVLRNSDLEEMRKLRVEPRMPEYLRHAKGKTKSI